MGTVSLLKVSGLPESFAVVLLTFAFILVLVPYFSAHDFGIFKIPQLSPRADRWCRLVAPLSLGFLILASVPFFQPSENVAAAREYEKRAYETFRKKRWGETRAAFIRAAGLAPSTQEWEIEKCQWFYNAALAAEYQQDWAAASDLYGKSLKLVPEDPQIHASLSRVLIEMKRWVDARNSTDAALRLASAWPLWGGTTEEELRARLRDIEAKSSSAAISK